ncbi:MAG: hypothetical protein IJV98_00440 [Clostridia bacterium]|nr:hypothetical protein [Clostridia bacterium]
MKKISNMVWGILLIGAGVLFGLKALGIWDFDLFFDGWWTLFIIIPCAIGLFTEREKTGNVFGLCLGIALLLCCQDVLSFSMLWKLLIPVAIIVVGVKMILSAVPASKTNEMLDKMKAEGREPVVGCATFSGCDLRLDGEIFEGADLTAAFGGVKCDLKHAVIEKDCAIRVSAIFGGIDILVPDHINVKVNANCIFGGVSNKTQVRQDAPTLYVSGICMFGGVDIK